ncbi:S8 family peptidase [Clostridium sp. KNHs205]|uniref:S8 family peptidase n=1 Tax=Clostridium sp. KNHs205 TaxID=1449050 RepID=UPI000689958F|nr:S8 family peptidase [Clostridium sp. KNHs205]
MKREKDYKRELKEPYTKQRQIKKVQQLSIRDTEGEWNIKAIKADTLKRNNVDPARIQVFASSSNSYTGNRVKVAIIDSGVDYTEDIEVYMRKNFIPGEDGISVLYEDSLGHGSSVAGIIAANGSNIGITGINPNVELYSARVLDRNNSAPVSRVIEAIYWAIERKVNIINISFGTNVDSEALKKAVKDAHNEGILLVAAAGNKGKLEYPAAYDEVIAVGSVNSKGIRSKSSPVSSKIELMAPGEQVLTIGDLGGMLVASGTSMAAPHVTGAASLLWQKDLTVSGEFIRKLLDYSANLYGNPQEYGYGLLDVEYAMEQYDTFKAAYSEEKSLDNILKEAQAKGELPENTHYVYSFNAVDYVKGSWLSDAHYAFAEENSSESGNPMTDGAIAVVKLGAIVADNELSGFNSYPQFHGFMTKQTGSIYQSNYLASYLYLTHKAVGLYNNTAPVVPLYLTGFDRNGIDTYLTTSGFNGKSWSTLLGGNTVNERNKALFVFGMAMHSVTDLYAHSTYTPEGAYINHAMGADLTTFYPNRYACARQIAQILISHIKRFEPGDISDFNAVATGQYDGTFKMGRLSQYVKSVDLAFYNANSTAIENMNINR